MFVSKLSTYYFHMKTKIIPDFQICISVPLNKSFIWISNFVHLIFWKNKFNAGIVLFHDTRSKNLLSNDSRSNDARFILKLSKQAQIMQGKLCYQKAKFYSTKNRAAGPCEQTFLRDIMLGLAVDFRQISTYINYRDSPLQMICKIAFLRNYTKLTGNRLYQSLFIRKLQTSSLKLKFKRDSRTDVSLP